MMSIRTVVLAAAVMTVELVPGFVPRPSAQSQRARIDVSALGPKVGETVPAFRLSDQRGRWQSLASIVERRGAMLVFVRSADW